MDAKKNLVLGLAKGYNWYTLEPFVRSCIKNISNADMVLFVGDMSPFTIHMLEEVKKEFNGGELKLLPFKSELYPGHPANTRWLAFRDFLNEHAEEYSQVLCADTRDAICQTDIFELFSDKGDYFASAYYKEDFFIGKRSPNTIAAHMFDGVKESFGEEKAEFLRDKRALCPSVFLASSGEMKKFISILCEYVKNWDVFTSDEVAFDYLIHTDIPKLKNRIDIDSASGEIMHTHNLNNICPIKTENEFILNPAGTVPAMIHFYDRSALLMNFVDNFYRSKNLDFDENFIDEKSLMDQLPHLIFAEKFDDALKILLNNFFGQTIFFKETTSKKNNFDALTEENKKTPSENKFKGDGDAFIRMWEMILQKDLQVTHSLEVLEVSIQRALMDIYDEVLPLYRAEKICACIKIAEKQGHIVSLNFKKYVLKKLFERANFFADSVDVPRFFPVMLAVMDLIEDLKLPLGEEWRKIKNRAYDRCSFLFAENDDKKRVYYRPYRIDADFENGGIK